VHCEVFRVPLAYAYRRDLVAELPERGTTAAEAEAGPSANLMSSSVSGPYRAVHRSISDAVRRVAAVQPPLRHRLGEAAERVVSVAPFHGHRCRECNTRNARTVTHLFIQGHFLPIEMRFASGFFSALMPTRTSRMPSP